MIAESIILGALASGAVQWLKGKLKTDKTGTLAIVALGSFVLACLVWLLQKYNLWTVFGVILGTASVIYNFVLQHFEDPGVQAIINQNLE